MFTPLTHHLSCNLDDVLNGILGETVTQQVTREINGDCLRGLNVVRVAKKNSQSFPSCDKSISATVQEDALRFFFN